MSYKDLVSSPLSCNRASSSEGELLVSLQLIAKRDIGEKFSKPPAIAPPMRQAWIEVIAVGVRNVKPFGGAARGVGDAIREPFVKMVVPGVDLPTIYQTERSSKPRGRDANFLSHQVRHACRDDVAHKDPVS